MRSKIALPPGRRQMKNLYLSDSGLDLTEGTRHLTAAGQREAELARDLREREDAAHHRAAPRRRERARRGDVVEIDHQRVLAAGAAQGLEHMTDARRGPVAQRDS